MATGMPRSRQTLATSSESVATRTSSIWPLATAALHTHSTIGLPAISRNTLRGRRVEARRAGMTPRIRGLIGSGSIGLLIRDKCKRARRRLSNWRQNKCEHVQKYLDKERIRRMLGIEHVQNIGEGETIMHVVVCYLSYLAISIALTVWVARTLHKNGRVFLVDAFHGNAELADSVNHLLVVGFYLINVGYRSLALKTADIINTSRAAIELLSDKMGMVLLILGGMHFFNLFVFSRIRKGA